MLFVNGNTMKVLVLFCFIAACSASSSYKTALYQSAIERLLNEIRTADNAQPKISVNINKYVDDVLKLAQLEIVKDGLDPLTIPDIEEGFSAKLGLITWHGEFTLTKGWLQGLSTIMRSGDSLMNYEHQFLNLRLPLQFDVIDLNYDYLAKIMNIGPKGGLEGKIKDFNIFIDITIDTKTMEIILQNFEITDAGHITVHFSGNPLVDWLTNVLTDLATRLLHNVAINAVEKEIRGILEKAIDSINNSIQPSAY